LKPGEAYTFKVKSANSEGWSDYSKESGKIFTLTDKPETPERPQINQHTKTSVSITMKVKQPYDNGASVLSYVVHKREMSAKGKTPWHITGTFQATHVEKMEDFVDMKLNTTERLMIATITVGDLTPGSNYDFKVAARNNSGISEWSPSTYRTKTANAQVPKEIGRVWCSEVGPTSMVVNWEKPIDNGKKILGYVVQEWTRDYDGVPLEKEDSDNYECGGGIERKRMDAMDPTVSYRFRVQSRNELGYSGWSEFSERIETCANDANRARGEEKKGNVLGGMSFGGGGNDGGVESDSE